MKKYINKREKGITLIALIVTIIILLILAGVTISFVIGNNGIFKIAENSAEVYKNAEEREKNELAKLENYVQNGRDTVTIPKEEYDRLKEDVMQMFFPTNTLNINAFSDTTTEQTYTIPETGWLYIQSFRTDLYFEIVFYRNDMLVYRFYGGGPSEGMNTTYIPVKKGDVIKKTQNNTGFVSLLNLYY